MTNHTGLDQHRIQNLTIAILKPIRRNFVAGSFSRDRCFEALNALGGAAAIIILGSDGPNGEARNFFEKALKLHLENVKIAKKEDS